MHFVYKKKPPKSSLHLFSNVIYLSSPRISSAASLLPSAGHTDLFATWLKAGSVSITSSLTCCMRRGKIGWIYFFFLRRIIAWISYPAKLTLTESIAHRRTQFEVSHSDINSQSRVFALPNIKRTPVFIKKLKIFSPVMRWVYIIRIWNILDWSILYKCTK